MFEKFAAFNELHNKVDPKLILKHVLHPHEEGMVIRVENILFQVDIFYLLVFKHEIFPYTLHCVEFAVLTMLHNVYFAEGATANHLLYIEVGEFSIWIGSVHHHGCAHSHRVLYFIVSVFDRLALLCRKGAIISVSLISSTLLILLIII